jgi:hypothetical protein
MSGVRVPPRHALDSRTAGGEANGRADQARADDGESAKRRH